MIRLYLLRHAKSSWSDPSLHDFDRPLNKRGKKDAPRIGQAMNMRGYHPDRILCSSSQRTKETLAGIVPGLTGEVSLHLLDALYEGNAPDYLSLLKANARNSKHLMLVGHNSGLQDVALRLAGSGDPLLIKKMRSKYPTAALAVLDFDCDHWDDITLRSGHLVDFIKPRDLDLEFDTDEDIIVENPAPTFFRR
ncbi:histidine phosphatase family protein [uncultured Cohaesibacter sp.]|uniref:SixA phosphatase family protein n=1 Tax=uncultured Cohaesibacter sp. TaxID=1002546 RepID=UPI0029309C5A|nr:histidine phosphatase family protein [uncultured Cohaesibacter sp.]